MLTYKSIINNYAKQVYHVYFIGRVPRISVAFSARITYVLRDSFILDTGSIDYVCNNYQCFDLIVKAKREEQILAGTSYSPILGQGQVTIYPRRPNGITDGNAKIVLKDVAYVLNMVISLVLIDRLIKRNFHFNTINLSITH